MNTPSAAAIEAAEKIMGSKAVENTNQSRYRDQIAEVIQAAISEAYNKGISDASRAAALIALEESRTAQEKLLEQPDDYPRHTLD